MLCKVIFPRTSKRLRKRILDIFADGQDTRSVDVPMSVTELQIDLPEKCKLHAAYVDAQNQTVQTVSREFDLSQPNERDITTLNVYVVPVAEDKETKDTKHGQVGTGDGGSGRSGQMPVRGGAGAVQVSDSVNLTSKVSAPRVVEPSGGGKETTETVQDKQVPGSPS